MIVFAWFYSAFLAPGDPPPTATSPIQTVTPLPTDEDEAGRRLVTESLIPTPTKAPSPTATPEPEDEDDGALAAFATASSGGDEPEPTATPEEEIEVAEEPTATIEEEVAEEPPTPTGPTVTVSFSPTADIWLTVIDDTGYVWYDGAVAAGETVGPFTAAYFDFYTSDVNDTWITNHDTGNTFYMGEEDGEGSYSLAPV
jgi:hypothetical protein